MRVVTADGRNVAVGGGALAASSPSSWAGRSSVKLVAGPTGRRRAVRFATIARTNPWVRAAVDHRASAGSRVPIHVFRPLPGAEGPGARERVRVGGGGPGENLVRLLDNPDTLLSARRWRRRIITDRLLHEGALIEKVRRGSQLVALEWHPWVDVEIVPSADGRTIEAFEVPTVRHVDAIHGGHLGVLRGRRIRRGPTRIIDRDDAIHVLDVEETTLEHGAVGVPILASMHATQALHDAAMRFAIAYMDNGVFPSGVVELHPQATAAAAQATRELLATLHARVENAGEPLAVAGSWKQVMATPEGAKLLELARWSREEVAAGFRIPLPVLGDLSSTNRATSETARKQFVRDVVGDDVSILESELQAQMVVTNRRWAAAGVWVEGQPGELLRPDLEAMAKVLADMVGGPTLTIDEGRGLINRPPLPDGEGDRMVLNPGTPDSSSGTADDEDDEDDDV